MAQGVSRSKPRATGPASKPKREEKPRADGPARRDREAMTQRVSKRKPRARQQQIRDREPTAQRVSRGKPRVKGPASKSADVQGIKIGIYIRTSKFNTAGQAGRSKGRFKFLRFLKSCIWRPYMCTEFLRFLKSCIWRPYMCTARRGTGPGQTF